MSPFNQARPRLGQAAIVLLGLFLAGLALPTPGQQPPPPALPSAGTVRVQVDVVQVYCTVKDKKGRLLTDLEASDFEIREDGKKQELRYFDRETDRPLTLALLLDTSGSQQEVLPTEKETVTEFLRQVLRPSDLALLITFDVDVNLEQDFTSEVEPLRAALERARINVAGSAANPGPFPRNRIIGTRLYDAVYLASKKKLGPEVGRKAIILVSDGEDFGSSVTQQEALEAAHRSDAMVYAIGIADPELYWRAFGRPYQGRGVLEKLAEETGGQAIFPSSPDKLQESFDQIAAELRSQYRLGYTPTNRARDGGFRKIEIKLKPKGLRVQARRGYYAPAS